MPEFKNEADRIIKLLDLTVEERDNLIRKQKNKNEAKNAPVVDISDDIRINITEYSHVPEKDPNFVGREKEIETFLKKLIEGQTLGITGFRGMGGVGKTAIAVEVCNLIKTSWNVKPEYPDYISQNDNLDNLFKDNQFFKDGILWIRFEKGVRDIEKVIEQIIIQVGGKGLLNRLKDIEDLIRILQKQKKDVLIVLDSAEQNKDIFWQLYKKFKGKFAILVTSREKFAGINMVDIEKMNEGEAIELFLKYLNRDVSPTDIKNISKLCKTIDYLPIAIKVLSSRAYITEQSIDKIIKGFKTKKLACFI